MYHWNELIHKQASQSKRHRENTTIGLITAVIPGKRVVISHNLGYLRTHSSPITTPMAEWHNPKGKSPPPQAGKAPSKIPILGMQGVRLLAPRTLPELQGKHSQHFINTGAFIYKSGLATQMDKHIPQDPYSPSNSGHTCWVLKHKGQGNAKDREIKQTSAVPTAPGNKTTTS